MSRFEDGLTLLIVGNDRLSRRLLHELGRGENLEVLVDRSTSISRVARLILRRSLRISDILKMAAAETRRKNFPLTPWVRGEVSSNDELFDALRDIAPRRLLLFRAGLIVNSRVLAQGIEIFNVHCASISTHGGLASISRALKDGAYSQQATLHRVTKNIDEGETIAAQPYRLDPKRSYYWNEEAAYSAGIALITRLLRPKNSSMSIEAQDR